jgi:hypothetical protein
MKKNLKNTILAGAVAASTLLGTQANAAVTYGSPVLELFNCWTNKDKSMTEQFFINVNGATNGNFSLYESVEAKDANFSQTKTPVSGSVSFTSIGNRPVLQLTWPFHSTGTTTNIGSNPDGTGWFSRMKVQFTENGTGITTVSPRDTQIVPADGLEIARLTLTNSPLSGFLGKSLANVDYTELQEKNTNRFNNVFENEWQVNTNLPNKIYPTADLRYWFPWTNSANNTVNAELFINKKVARQSGPDIKVYRLEGHLTNDVPEID